MVAQLHEYTKKQVPREPRARYPAPFRPTSPPSSNGPAPHPLSPSPSPSNNALPVHPRAAALFDHTGELRGSYRGPRSFAFTLASTPAMLPAPSAMKQAPPLQGRQNYHPDCEAAINSHFTLELHASLFCLAVAVYVHRDDVMAMNHFTWFFLRHSRQHKKRAQGLMRLQNKRGGHVRFQDIWKPVSDNWKSGLKAMKCALFLENRVNQSLLHLHQLATEQSDPHLRHFLATHYLSQQVAFITELEGHVTTLSMMEAPDVDLAGSLFDKLTLGDSDKN
ncbi:ferritin heavy chain-like [Mesoplodon densirostris]|uniref:ferritin heavy chain-like n=1 Tax=Mesoplodon densirostris TaxID=48708 RepID=UPI0028DB35DF|nr:ferritin heavy chain-like [Mesoplodon densirostris]